MGLTFDEAVREYKLCSSIGPLVQGMKLSPFVNVPQQEYDRVKFLNNLFYETINKLRQEYAPTVEMTKGKYAFITSEYERENVVDAVANLTVDDFLRENFDAKFWEPLTQREVVQAWLHPETIKVVD